MFLTEKYPECFIKYNPKIKTNKTTGETRMVGIKCTGTDANKEVIEGLEKRVDIAMAIRAGCSGIEEICNYLNGER